MPYIKSEERPRLDEHLDKLKPEHEGELNYCITKLLVNFLKKAKQKAFKSIIL